MTVVPAGETPEDGTWELVWDAWSRLVEVNRVIDGEVVSSTRHQYDGLFRRTRSVRPDGPAETRDYYYNQSWKVIEERVESSLGNHTDQFVYGIRGRNDIICRDRTEGATTTRHYALSDAMGSVTAIVDDAGGVEERYGYSAFGMSRVMDADFDPLTTSAHDWQIRFHGETRDSATGWYNYGFRYYLPEQGRWPSRDPIGEEGGFNLYAFVDNVPIIHIDYLGQISVQPGQPRARQIWLIAFIKVELTFSCVCDPDEGEITPMDLALCEAFKDMKVSMSDSATNLDAPEHFDPVKPGNPNLTTFFVVDRLRFATMTKAENKAIKICKEESRRCNKYSHEREEIDIKVANLVKRIAFELEGFDNLNRKPHPFSILDGGFPGSGPYPDRGSDPFNHNP